MTAVRLALVAAVLAALGLAYGWGRRDGRALERAAAGAALVQAQAVAAARAKEMKDDVEKVAEDFWQREQDLQGRVLSADRAVARLRQAVVAADRRGAADGSGGVDAATTARRLLAECGAELAAVAGSADRLAVQLRGLQGYVRATAEAR